MSPPPHPSLTHLNIFYYRVMRFTLGFGGEKRNWTELQQETATIVRVRNNNLGNAERNRPQSGSHPDLILEEPLVESAENGKM